MKNSHLAIAALLPLLASCGGLSVYNNTLAVPADATFALSEVTFDYSSFSNQEAEFLEQMRKNEESWRATVQKGFVRGAGKRGLAEGAGESAAVRIVIEDLDPGSQAMRYFVGFGAGTGVVRVLADCGAHGSVRVTSDVSGGFFGGDFEPVLDEVGSAVAYAIANAREEGKEDGN